jgi:phospholipid transport system substrate-binding protein
MRAVRGALVLALIGLATPAVAADEAVGVIQGFCNVLQETLRDADALGYEGRLKKLTPEIEKTFDLEFMARTAIGQQWKDLSEEERKRWVDAFSRMTIANYAGRFNHYSGQSFEVLGSEPASNDTVFVRTRVIVPNEENVDVSYRMRDAGEVWKVIDVYLKGTVSELALRRSEYSAVLKRDGIEGLVHSIDEKIAGLKAEGDAPGKALAP